MPINVTLLFSSKHYVAAAEAYLRGIERRTDAGLSLQVQSMASLFVSRWDAAVKLDWHRLAGMLCICEPYSVAGVAPRA